MYMCIFTIYTHPLCFLTNVTYPQCRRASQKSQRNKLCVPHASFVRNNHPVRLGVLYLVFVVSSSTMREFLFLFLFFFAIFFLDASMLSVVEWLVWWGYGIALARGCVRGWRKREGLSWGLIMTFSLKLLHPRHPSNRETQSPRYKFKLFQNLNLNLHCEIPRNLSFLIWWISGMLYFQWNLSYQHRVPYLCTSTTWHYSYACVMSNMNKSCHTRSVPISLPQSNMAVLV